jgi:hypothetical protein
MRDQALIHARSSLDRVAIMTWFQKRRHRVFWKNSVSLWVVSFWVRARDVGKRA